MSRTLPTALALVVFTMGLAKPSHGASTEPPHGTCSQIRSATATVHVKLPAQVDTICIDGLERTSAHVVRRELGFAEGDVLTQGALDLATTRLWNTTIFARVETNVVRVDGRNVVSIRVEDRWTLNPLFRLASGGGALLLRLGAADNNVAGRFVELQGQYEYFNGFHGGQVIFRNPRLFGQRLELAVQAERLVRPRQGFADQRTLLQSEVARLGFSDRLRAALKVSAFSDRFLPPLESAAYFPSPSETLTLETSLRIGRVDVVRIRQRGASLEFRPSLGFSHSDATRTYVGAQAELLAFAMVGARCNLALRARIANVSKTPPHLELWAGGFDVLRGFPDNYVRTRAMAFSNAEVRVTAFDSTWIALMPTAFVDAIGARSPDGSVGTAVAVGAGLRVLVPKFVGTGLRADLALPIHASFRTIRASEQSLYGPVTPAVTLGRVGPNFGVYQFF